MIKLLVSDIDGVWTDGSFYYSCKGDAMRRFSVRDGFGVKMANASSKNILIISGEQCLMVEHRLQKLGITNYGLGVRNKLDFLRKFCDDNNYNLNDVAYLGDDLNDLPIINKVGLFCCPIDAHELVRRVANKTLSVKGGDGVFRMFVEYILKEEDVYNFTIDSVIKSYES